ncbi:hypothetical protein [Phytoactinopolyspora alkaliphila]|uniref:hypothetical protein n=1 Tax=Phytoactinopolyspora alkaliphila TaxID=1783498 RepID=UPI003CCCB733
MQIADAPGRGAPGTGERPIGAWVDEMLATGYAGWIALEYLSDTADPFAWINEGIRA